MRVPGGHDESPGRSGRWATTEVDARSLKAVSIVYSPRSDERADPGEVVWTWVPYEEHDGRGKDRPVLVVATLPDGSLVGVQLTSKPHDDRWTLPLGAGPWDASGRPSWVRVDRVFRLHQGGIRRRGVGLDERRFTRVARELVGRYGWSVGRSTVDAGASGGGFLRRMLARLLGR